MQRRNFILGLSGILASSQAPAILTQGTAMKLWRPESLIVPSQISEMSRLLALWPGWKFIEQGHLVGMENGNHRVFAVDMSTLMDEHVIETGNSLTEESARAYYHRMVYARDSGSAKNVALFGSKGLLEYTAVVR